MQAQRTGTIKPMRFHGPGWTLDLSEHDEEGELVALGALYQLWAPQSKIIRDPAFPEMWSTDRAAWYPDSQQPREHWTASWQSGDGEAGDFVKGRTAHDVLRIFPDGVARRFREVLP